jgi:CspA family cold shock protein
MSLMSSQHQLTATGRVIVNTLFAAAIFVGLGYVPATPYNTLAALLLMALLGSYTASISIPKPKPSTSQKARGGKRLQGSVKWFNGTKGFGFITGDDGAEVFVHFRSVEGLGKRSIKPGQRVSYVTRKGDRGPQAEEVKPL